jgi:hypothetical protein
MYRIRANTVIITPQMRLLSISSRSNIYNYIFNEWSITQLMIIQRIFIRYLTRYLQTKNKLTCSREEVKVNQTIVLTPIELQG